MALQDSGAISWGDIRTEFGLSGSFSIGSLRGDGCRPSIPASGAISANDFYSVIARSGQITTAGVQAGQTYPKVGFAETNAVNTTPHAAFGALSKKDLFVLGNSSKALTAVVGWSFPSTGTPQVLLYTNSSTSSDGDWSQVGFTDVLPVSSSTNSTYLRNKTSTIYPNYYVNYLIGGGVVEAASNERWTWKQQVVPISGQPTGGLYPHYFTNFYSGISAVTLNPIVYII